MKHDNFCEHNPANILKIALFAIVGVALAILFGLAFGWVVQYLWNHIVVSLFPIRAISYLEAVGIIVLCKLLFGGFGGGHNHDHVRDRRDRSRRFDYRHAHEFFGDNKDEFAAFWESEGKEAYKAYTERKKQQNTTTDGL